MNISLKFIFAIIIALSAPRAGMAEEYPIEVGWIPLLANPKQYDGKKIALTGWITVYLAKDAARLTIFMSREAVTCTDLTLGLVVESKSMEKFLDKPNEMWQLFNNERVRLEGTFRAINWENQPTGVPGRIENVEAFRQVKPGSPMFDFK